MTLTEFLTARLDEDAAVAQAAVIPAHDAPNAWRPHAELARWRYAVGGEVEVDYDDPDGDVWRVTSDSEGILPAVTEQFGPHIARNDPERVLAEVAAKRRIVGWRAGIKHPQDFVHEAVDNERQRILRLLASAYADHPDFDPAWAD